MTARFLMADDEESIHRLGNVAFKDSDYEVDHVNDGEEALQKALEIDYNLVITDLQMPRRDGASLIKKLRKKERKMPILVLSAYITADLHKELSAYGDVTLLGKPVRPDELRSTAERILKEQEEDDD